MELQFINTLNTLNIAGFTEYEILGAAIGIFGMFFHKQIASIVNIFK